MTLDIGIGIFAAIIVSKVSSIELSPLLIALGIVFALLPDIDFIYSVARKGHRDHRAIAKHRDLVHYPLIYLPAGALAALAFGPEWSLLFLLASVGHFIHDSIGIGWGIPWLWPFTNKNYSFIYKYSPRYNGQNPRNKLVYAWEREKIDELIDHYGDPDWLRNIYFRFHPFFIAEIVFFLIALIALWHVKI